MEIVVLVIHIFLAAAIIGVILLQPPESGSLGGLGGANPMAGAASRGQSNFLTRTTAILATGFIITSLILAYIAGHKPQNTSILDQAQIEAVQDAATDTGSVENEIEPVVPSVPLSK